MQAKHRYPLKKKTMLVMIIAFTVVGIASVALFYKGAIDIASSEYETHCSDLASTVARSLDVDQVEAVSKKVLGIYRSLDPSQCMLSDQEDEPGYDEYLAHYKDVEKMKEFISLRKALRRSQDAAHVECLYITFPDIKTSRLIYFIDGSYEDVWHPGTLEVLYDTDFRDKGNITSGFGTLISDTEDGKKLVTTAMPIFDYNNKVIAYAGLDYSIESLLENQRNYMLLAILMIAFLAAISAFIVIKLVDKQIVKPINALSDASVRYYSDDPDGDDIIREGHRFSDLNIHTGDEIETLAESMSKMERDINEHIEALLSTRNELLDTKEYAEEMERTANKDPLTGVRNKRAYEASVVDLNGELKAGTERFGIAVIDMNDLKLINDNYGHEHGDEAIMMLCTIICEVFKHSPVFRYGGDEFVVILKNHDLDNIDSLICRFRDEIEEFRGSATDPWLKVDAAIGYAKYDPDEDEYADSVFERADKAMYEDKLREKGNDRD